MITPSQIEYLDRSLRDHVKRYFLPDVVEAFDALPIRWVTMEEANKQRGRVLVIPIDVPCDVKPANPWRVPFLGTELTLWNPIDPPSEEWAARQPHGRPLWHFHPSGAVMPAWNLAPTLFGLLSLEEEISSEIRDRHGRFIGAMSHRSSGDLLEAPVFNDSVAALVELSLNFQNNRAADTELTSKVALPPVIVLSHDLDQLRGNDRWTQVVRLVRMVRPMLKFRPPDLKFLWYFLYNFGFPRKFYFENIVGMMEVERMHGFRSSQYFLNGSGGRFGARSGSKLIPEVAERIPVNWSVGVHYNYDTHLEEAAFAAQLEELKELTNRKVATGRAHYLRFDPARSWSFLAKMGIKVDESLGYPDRIGYRAGVAGVFRPYDRQEQSMSSMLEMPLVIMESTLVNQYPDDPAGAFERLLAHIEKVGGAISILFHPGSFCNPEESSYEGLYFKMLAIARRFEAVSLNADELR